MKYEFLKTKKKIIYLRLLGRIGNQFFQYCFARKMYENYGKDKAIIVIDDSDCVKKNWANLLPEFNIDKDVYFVHENILFKNIRFIKFFVIRNIFHIFRRSLNFIKKYNFEKKYQNFLNIQGLILCDNGYMNFSPNYSSDMYIEGYFQSEKYFIDIKSKVIKELTLKNTYLLNDYPNYKRIVESNTICISAKFEHNVGNKIFDVCTSQYWKNTIEFMKKNVKNPLFFICSDNVDYVTNNLLANCDIPFVCQSKDKSVQETLVMMSKCKYFIIGNTTFAYWAQYLSDNKKIVIAPKKWVAVEMPVDIYDNDWVLM